MISNIEEMHKQNKQIRQIVNKNKQIINDNGQVKKHQLTEKITLLSNVIDENCKPCENTHYHLKMLKELAEDMPKIDKANKAVLRSVEKRFAHIIKHLQKEHNYSLKNQYRDAWLILLVSLFCILGVVASAFTDIYAFPFIGIVLGAILGYFIGSNIDAKMENENKVLII